MAAVTDNGREHAPTIARRIVDHWERVITAAPLATEPFEHFFVDGIWPDDIYPRLLQSLPPLSLYKPINLKKWVRANGESTRDRIVLTEESLGRFPDGIRDFWREVWLAITSDAMKRLVFSTLRNDLSLRMDTPPDDVADATVWVGGTLTRDTEDYRIKPHPDGYPRLVTMQFYLPESPDQIDLGTSLYVREPVYRWATGRRFREVKRFPYRANSGYAFAVNDRPDRRSLHGRELISKGAGARNSLLFSWYAEPPHKEKSSSVAVTETHQRL